MPPGFRSLALVAVLAAVVPVLLDLLPARLRLPQVVVLLLGGVALGPYGLHVIDPAPVQLFSSVGLGFLFLLAGYEVDPALLGSREGRRAATAWVISLVLGVAVALTALSAHVVGAFGALAIALTTTALGTLLPILRDNDLLTGPFALTVVANGAVGELAPILAMAVFLGAHLPRRQLAELVAFALLAGLLVVAQRRLAGGRLHTILRQRSEATSQAALRVVVALLFVLLTLTADLGFDAVLGAFAAGMVVRVWVGGHHTALEDKLDAVGFGVFIPVFFIYSGLTLDVPAIEKDPTVLVVCLAALVVVRGGPVMVIYRRLPARRRLALALLSATALPLLVALTQIGLDTHTMTPTLAASLVGAGALTVLAFPMTALALLRPPGVQRLGPADVPVASS